MSIVKEFPEILLVNPVTWFFSSGFITRHSRVAEAPDRNDQGLRSLNNFESFLLPGIKIDAIRKDVLRFDESIRPIVIIDDLLQFVCCEQAIVFCDQNFVDA